MASEPHPEAPGDTGDRSPETPETPTPDEAAREAIARGRARRQAVLRRRQRTWLSDTQQWIFVALALAIALAWIFGRDKCSDVITQTYGTLDPRSAKDGGPSPARRPAVPPPRRDASPGDDW